MLCDRCKRNEANVHITRIVNGVRYEQNLCSQCAAVHTPDVYSMGSSSGMEQLMDFFRNLGMVGLVVASHEGGPRPAMVGIGHPDLDDLGLHVPGSEQANAQGVNLDGLKAELSSCVAQEKFERAAELRDQIFNLERELEAQN